MKKSFGISFAGLAFVACSALCLTACGDDNSSGAGEGPSTSENKGESIYFTNDEYDGPAKNHDGVIYPPQELCTSEDEGDTLYYSTGYGRFVESHLFICKAGSWKEPGTPSVSEQCTKEDTKVGDTCSVYVSSGAEGTLGIPGVNVMYVYRSAGNWEPVCQIAANGECKEQSSDSEEATELEEPSSSSEE